MNKKVVKTSNNHRTTILTTSRREFARVSRLKGDEIATIECPNDIVSSARGHQDDKHHAIRRVTLLRRAIASGFRRVRVRFEQGNEIYCTICGNTISGKDDSPSLKISVSKPTLVGGKA